MTTKLTLSQLRKQADSLNLVVFKRGSQWIISASMGNMRNEIPLHYSVNTERKALEQAITMATRS